jgi:uncharacterized membrane protein YfhO
VYQIDKLNSGDKVKITVRTEGISYGLWNMDLYLNDNTNLGDMVETLKKGGFVAEEVKQNKLTGTVTAENHNQLFFTSIPNDGGWSVYCDGEKIEIVEIADSLVGFRTPQGEHTIKFVYHSKGFLPGLLIAIISLIVLVWVNYGEKFKKKKRD